MLFHVSALVILFPWLCLSNHMNTLKNLSSNKYFYDKQTISTQHSNQKWMKSITDNVPLDLVIIPGTHDSATYCIKEFKAYSVTQSLTIYQQLELGIRYLDIRLCYSKDIPSSLFICHGILTCKLTFDKVMDSIIKFLNNNPSEGIILKVQNERKLFKDQINKLLIEIFLKYSDYFFQTNTIPMIGQLRKKFLLMLSDINLPQFSYIQWLQLDIFAFQIDFVYKSKKEKRKQILAMDALIAQTTLKGKNPLSFYVNEFSANGLPAGNLFGTIKSIAKDMNPIITELHGRVGILIFDYPSQELIAYLLNQYLLYLHKYYETIIKTN